MSEFIPIAKLSELSITQGKAIKVKEHLIALFLLEDGSVYAIENSCPHIGAPLDNGIIEGGELTCLWHGWTFSLSNGESTNCPGVRVTTFPVRIQGDLIFILI
ncbi:MAG: Rieske 2Fe-2S domain-containing protein [Candidatus Caenarcaniphilales bacterium]|nr:Rieske 2Fe-2S domain-containing protein [Candidatus Caenarcaniphilales bacterium]